MRRPRVPYLFPDGSQLGRDNLVLRASARRHRVKDFLGPLSIKSVLHGEVTWIVEGRKLVIDSNTFLILNDGQKYSMELDAHHPVETCCAFFQQGFVERVAQDMTSPLQTSLDTPMREAPPILFLSRLHTDTSGGILPRLRSLAERCSTALQPSSFEEDFLILSQEITALQETIAEQVARVPAAKQSTREELFRRLERAREFLHSSVEEKVSLEDISREACLSRYHLHRAFVATFQQTPHAYLTALRLNRARSLLNRGSSVTEACYEVGFTSMSAFSRLFHAHFGVRPSTQIRKIGQGVR